MLVANDRRRLPSRSANGCTQPTAADRHVTRCACWSLVAQRDLVRLGDVAGLDGSQTLAETLASLSMALKRAGEGALRSGALRISVVLFEQACLKSRSDFTGRLERLIDGLFPRDVVRPWRVSRAAGSAS